MPSGSALQLNISGTTAPPVGNNVVLNIGGAAGLALISGNAFSESSSSADIYTLIKFATDVDFFSIATATGTTLDTQILAAAAAHAVASATPGMYTQIKLEGDPAVAVVLASATEFDTRIIFACHSLMQSTLVGNLRRQAYFNSAVAAYAALSADLLAYKPLSNAHATALASSAGQIATDIVLGGHRTAISSAYADAHTAIRMGAGIAANPTASAAILTRALLQGTVFGYSIATADAEVRAILASQLVARSTGFAGLKSDIQMGGQLFSQMLAQGDALTRIRLRVTNEATAVAIASLLTDIQMQAGVYSEAEVSAMLLRVRNLDAIQMLSTDAVLEINSLQEFEAVKTLLIPQTLLVVEPSEQSIFVVEEDDAIVSETGNIVVVSD